MGCGPHGFHFLFEAGAARVRRSTSTTAPGSTFLVITCAGCSPSCYSSPSSVRSQRASSLMGMFVMNYRCWGPGPGLYGIIPKIYLFIHHEDVLESSVFMQYLIFWWTDKTSEIIQQWTFFTAAILVRNRLMRGFPMIYCIFIGSENILHKGWQRDKSNKDFTISQLLYNKAWSQCVDEAVCGEEKCHLLLLYSSIDQPKETFCDFTQG